MNMHFDPERPFPSRAHLQTRSSRHRAVGKTIRDVAGQLAASMRRLAGAFAAWLVRRHLTQDLHALDDRMLADIGISRSDIAAIVNDAGGYRLRGDDRSREHRKAAG
jgi:uncharacterized protein YjiS (DUF1127 family)